MRNFQSLDKFVIEESTGILYISTQDEDWMHPRVSLRKEGTYVAISASYGPLEIAMRLRLNEFTSILARLRPIQGLQTTRQLGTDRTYITLGLQENGGLVIRPTIVGDATGHVCLNLILTKSVRQALFEWLPVTSAES